MNHYLLLILLSSWAHVVPLSLQCETGVAYPKHVLSIQRSLMANADVAVLKTYEAESLDKCITDCCTEKFGSCTVASFKKTNDTEANCQHFNCRPVQKCTFVSSNLTDSFSFSSSSSSDVLVPSSDASKNNSISSTVAVATASKSNLDISQKNEEREYKKGTIAAHTAEHFTLKNDNTTIKPRKGVEDVTENSFKNINRSGVKPRKGVSLDGLGISNNSRSKVKPRKGVGPFQSQSISPSVASLDSSVQKTISMESVIPNATFNNIYKDTVADNIVAALEKVFEDDAKVSHVTTSTIASAYTTRKNFESSTTFEKLFEDDSKVSHVTTSVIIPVHTTRKNSEISATSASSFIHTSTTSTYASISTEKSSFIVTEKSTPTSTEKSTSTGKSSALQSSIATNHIVSSTARTPDLVAPSVQTTEILGQYFLPSSSGPSIFEHSKLLFHESDSNVKTAEDESDSESQRKYKSSMHLVLSLIFGLLVLFSVLGVVAKRMYDNWVRRQYRRMDFLIDGMYNGYG